MSARRPWAWPLVPLYATGLAVKNSLRTAGGLRTRTLPRPVISIGSISAGGAGKTPVVISLAKLLRNRGWTVDILSRGYGRESDAVEHVDLETPNAGRRFGDEPVLIAHELGPEVPVWVGADRFTAGMQAEAAHPPAARAVHLLDDGFQHRQLARTVDIVLVTAEDLDDALLPAGNRREPLSVLRRANIVVLRENETPQLESRVRPYLRRDAVILTHSRTPSFPQPLGAFTAGDRPLAFCAIARPRGFTELLANSGISLAHTVNFRDHHFYTPEDVERLVSAARAHNATGFGTTAKDWVKFNGTMRARLAEIGPVMVVGLTAEFTHPDQLVQGLEARLG